MFRAGLVFDDRMILHDPGDGHPESPDRFRAVKRALNERGLRERMAPVAPRMASEDDLHLAHTRQYIAAVQHDASRRAAVLSTGDTGLGEHSLECAMLAAGMSMAAVDAVFTTPVRRAFAAIRPPGHHATASRGMGFCIFNNAAIAARYAQKAYGVDRILIADWDVHHGNGTQDIFASDPSVFYFSTHQWPWYPGTGSAGERGENAGKGTVLNCPLPAGSGRSQVLGAFRKKLLPAMRGYRPGLVILSAGFDSRRGDPLGRFTLSDADFGELTSLALEAADISSDGRVVSLLEGGYSLDGLTRAVSAHIEALLEL